MGPGKAEGYDVLDTITGPQGRALRVAGPKTMGLATLLSVIAALAVASPASALSWGSPVTVSASGELAQSSAPSVAMDATGGAVVAWSNYHSSDFSCPCQIRAVLRNPGGSFSSPATLATVNTVGISNVQVAMDAAGDAIAVWDQPVGPIGSTGGYEHQVWVALRPAGGSFGSAQQLSIDGTTADGGGAPHVAMDANGHAIVAWISGIGWFDTDPEPQLMLVRAAGGVFSSPAPLSVHHVTSGDNSGPWAFDLAMSPDGHAALGFTWQGPNTCSPTPCDPQGNTPENVEVATAAPGGQFGTPAVVSQTVTWPGPTSGPAENVESVAIDDSADVVASYTDMGSGPFFTATHRDEVVTSDAGAAFSSPDSLGASGSSFADPVAIGPNGESTVTYSDSAGLESRFRSVGGSFSAAHLISNSDDGDSLSLNTTSTGASGTVLEGVEVNPGFTGNNESIAAYLRQPGGAFGSSMTVFTMPSGSFFNEGELAGAIDKSGNAALLAWRQFSGGNYYDDKLGPVKVSLASNAPATHTLTVSKTGAGSVSSSPVGISCGSRCSHAFAAGATVTLKAHPAAGSRFAGWSGACTGGAASCVLHMTADKHVAAKFRPIPPPNTTITVAKHSSAKRTASFSFTGTGGVGRLHFKCKLDSGAFGACSSPKSYSHLKKGSHTFKVEAIDARGKVDPTPAVKAFRI
ncbi:MAG: InlB B-repeat-containing protein [Solirubrobacteraceae bacterium]